MDGVIVTSQKIIPNPKGDILHALKVGDSGYDGFGEAYFSIVNKNEIKGWKKHNLMTLNILVPLGEVEFVIYDGLNFLNIKLSKNNYYRLSIKPKLWVAFRGLNNSNMLLNLASHVHDPEESENLPLNQISYKW
ncbi:WxcM-like domain-containing protein [Gammaproteobacteria bacterium]|nr:WxcM-like domain-containing protein [Gammaproteobacteria bacterium]